MSTEPERPPFTKRGSAGARAPWTQRLGACLSAVVVAAAVLATASLAHAQTSVAWSSLTPAQRNVLASLRDDWSRIPADQQQKWLVIANRYPSLPTAEQERLHERMGSWAQLSPNERMRARRNWQEAQRFDGDDRRARWDAYQALSPEERAELARSARDAGEPVQSSRRAGGSSEGAKSNIVQSPIRSMPPSVRAEAQNGSPTAPGATTTLAPRTPQPPAHQQTGLPKIAVTPGFVEPRTLLPQRGAQGAAVTPQRNDDGDRGRARAGGGVDNKPAERRGKGDDKQR